MIEKGEVPTEDGKIEIIKKLIDGFYEPVDLVRDGGTSAFRDDPIFQALQCKLQVVHTPIYEPLDLVRDGETSALRIDPTFQALQCKLQVVHHSSLYDTGSGQGKGIISIP